MSLVENMINQITSSNLGGVTKPQGFDLNDDTFAKLLEKGLSSINNTEAQNPLGQMGAPAGLQIEPLEGTEYAQTVQDQMEALGEKNFISETSEPFEIKDVEMGDYFSNLLKTNTDSGKEFMNFAKKQATFAYNYLGKNYITDVKEFAQDIIAATR